MGWEEGMLKVRRHLKRNNTISTKSSAECSYSLKSRRRIRTGFRK